MMMMMMIAPAVASDVFNPESMWRSFMELSPSQQERVREEAYKGIVGNIARLLNHNAAIMDYDAPFYRILPELKQGIADARRAKRSAYFFLEEYWSPLVRDIVLPHLLKIPALRVDEKDEQVAYIVDRIPHFIPAYKVSDLNKRSERKYNRKLDESVIKLHMLEGFCEIKRDRSCDDGRRCKDLGEVEVYRRFSASTDSGVEYRRFASSYRAEPAACLELYALRKVIESLERKFDYAVKDLSDVVNAVMEERRRKHKIAIDAFEVEMENADPEMETDDVISRLEEIDRLYGIPDQDDDEEEDE